MTQGASQPLQMVLCDEESIGRIVVDHEAFMRFSGELDAALGRLQLQWRHVPPSKSHRRPAQRRRVQGE